jgi:hypothetical protein
MYITATNERSLKMKAERTIKAFIFFIFFVLIGCATTPKLKDYQPKSSEEKEVLDFMVECFEAHKEGNRTKFIACFNDNAKINFDPPGTDELIVSKRQAEAEYSKIIYKNLANSSYPKVSIMQDRAIFIGTTYRKGRSAPVSVMVVHTFDLVKENEKWSIIKWDFRQYY